MQRRALPIHPATLNYYLGLVFEHEIYPYLVPAGHFSISKILDRGVFVCGVTLHTHKQLGVRYIIKTSLPVEHKAILEASAHFGTLRSPSARISPFFIPCLRLNLTFVLLTEGLNRGTNPFSLLRTVALYQLVRYIPASNPLLLMNSVMAALLHASAPIPNSA
jgi:hypothetical protein